MRFAEVDGRNPRKKKLTFRDVAVFYGQRPKHELHPELWYLSPYEFVTYWEPVLLSYPQSLQDKDNPNHHAALTEEGVAKLRARAVGHDEELEPGTDYKVRSGGDDWVSFPEVSSTAHFRHTWILRRRRRPKAPSFSGAPVPRHASGQHQRSAMIVMRIFIHGLYVKDSRK